MRWRRRVIGRATAATALALLALACADPNADNGESAGAPPSATPTWPPTGGPGDAAPNHADNNAWKQRHDLAAAERSTGEELAARIRPRLEALRAAGDFAPASTRQALLNLGIDADAIEVTAMRPPVGEATPSPGAVYAVHFADVGCVIGDVRPERVMVEVTGSAAEFGCLEPFSH